MSKRPRPAFNVQSTTGGGSIADELMASSGGAGWQAPAPAPPSPPPQVQQPDAPAPAASARAEKPRPPKRVPIRVHVPEDLADRVRGTVAALAYQVDEWTSLNAATAAALERFVADAERTYNNGEPFPWNPGRQLQPGRKVGR